MRTPEQNSKIIFWLWFTFVILKTVDIVSTYIGVEVMGTLREANPIALNAFNYFGIEVTLIVIWFICFILSFLVMKMKGVTQQSQIVTFSCIVSLYLLVVGNNLYQFWRVYAFSISAFPN